MTDEKWRSPTRHSIASDVTDKLPPKGEARDDVQEALNWCAKIRILALNIQADDSFTKQLYFIEKLLMAQQQTVNAWQPIETAPKDIKILMGCWFNNEWYEDCGTQYSKNGRRTICVGFRKNEWPTHWMPLPTPPRAEQKGGE